MERTEIRNAIDYIEEHLEEKLDYAEIAKRAYCSSYHFQRVFSYFCRMTLGEYIRRRKLSRAADDLRAGEKVLSVAVKYGYESSESFSRAFFRFHGALPSQVKRGAPAKEFPPLSLKSICKEKSIMEITIEQRPSKILVGFSRRFHGVPFGRERLMQEDKFYRSTRGKQWLLLGASRDYSTEYAIVTNIGDDGYDFTIAYELNEWTRGVLFDDTVTGMDLKKLDFKTISLPARTCAVLRTENEKDPISEYTDLRERFVTEWLPESSYLLSDLPEVVELHWRMGKGRRFLEITLPVERKTSWM